MFFTVAAVAIATAAFKESFQEGGVDQIGRQLERLDQMGLALAQGQGGEALELCLTHNMSKIPNQALLASKNENAPEMRKCLTLAQP